MFDVSLEALLRLRTGDLLTLHRRDDGFSATLVSDAYLRQGVGDTIIEAAIACRDAITETVPNLVDGVVLPHSTPEDKWADPILPNGQRVREAREDIATDHTHAPVFTLRLYELDEYEPLSDSQPIHDYVVAHDAEEMLTWARRELYPHDPWDTAGHTINFTEEDATEVLTTTAVDEARRLGLHIEAFSDGDVQVTGLRSKLIAWACGNTWETDDAPVVHTWFDLGALTLEEFATLDKFGLVTCAWKPARE